ncbi:MAG: hypothetical protein RL689_1578, partial [Planctomycetota bacterium]
SERGVVKSLKGVELLQVKTVGKAIELLG